MLELYVYLFWGVEEDSTSVQWFYVVESIHEAIHQKLHTRDACTICNGARLRQDCSHSNRTCWTFEAVHHLWNATVQTIEKHGVAWPLWHQCVPSSSSTLPPPPLLQLENIPIDQIKELPDGRYKWGQYITEAGAVQRFS